MNIKDNLVESTLLALQGKLELKENRVRKVRKSESINVSISDNGSTIVDTEETTVTVQDKDIQEPEEMLDCPECIEEPTEVVEVPVEGDETIIPEEVAQDEMVSEEELASDDMEDESEEELEESKKIESKVTDYIDEEDLDEVIKDNPNFKDCKNYEAVEGMILKVSTKGYTDFDKLYKVNRQSDGKYYAHLTNDKNEKLGDEFYLFESKKVKTEKYDDKIGGDIEDFKSDIAKAASALDNVYDNCACKGAMDVIEDVQLYLRKRSTDYLKDKGAETEAKEIAKESCGDELKEGDLSKDLYADEAQKRTNLKLQNLDIYLENLAQAIEDKDEDQIELSKYKIMNDIGYLIPALNIKGGAKGLVDYIKNTEFGFENKFTETINVLEDMAEEYRKEYEESKKVAPKYSSKTFNKMITEFYKSKYKTVEGFKTAKISIKPDAIKVEGKLINIDGIEKNTCLEFRKIEENNSFMKYELLNANKVLKENKENNKLRMLVSNKNNILECKYLIRKK